MSKMIVAILGMLIVLNGLMIYSGSQGEDREMVYVPVDSGETGEATPSWITGGPVDLTPPAGIEPVVYNMNNLSKFESFDDMLGYLGPAANGTSYYGGYYSYGMGYETNMLAVADSSASNDVMMKSGISVAESSHGSDDYSTTNIQVAGVDEGDIVKNDGKYAYIVSEDRTHVNICEVYPAKQASLIGQIEAEGSIMEIYLDNSQLIVIEQCHDIEEITYQSYDYEYTNEIQTNATVVIRSWDVSDKSEIKHLNNMELPGEYVTSRIIGDYIYAIASQTTRGIEEDMLCVPANMTYYTETEDYGYNFNNFLCMNISNYEEEAGLHTILLGTSQTIFVSQNSIFLTGQKSYYSYSNQTTRIYKLALQKNSMGYVGEAEAPGTVLNRFSMDEYAGNFRIATTKGSMWGDGESKSRSQIWIFNSEMKEIGKLENIAPGEKIHSARFMGDRAYLVTFKKVDPFFVIDLADPESPKILGELKIPGYSDYLHIYDENHIIGVGKDTIEASDEDKVARDLDFAWYQGIKIALFDVSDVTDPIEEAKLVIGERGSDSAALRDPHAFTFSREKNLLVIPVTVYEGGNYLYGYGSSWVGAYAMHISPEDGITVEGKIQHELNAEYNEAPYYGSYWYSDYDDIERSFYIDNILYTVSGSMIKGHNMNGYDEVMKIEFGE